jgi:hypothetical protein
MSSVSSLERPVAAGVGVAIAGIAGVGVASAGKDSGAATLFSGITEPSSFTSIEGPGVSDDIATALAFRVVRISRIKLRWGWFLAQRRRHAFARPRRRSMEFKVGASEIFLPCAQGTN